VDGTFSQKAKAAKKSEVHVEPKWRVMDNKSKNQDLKRIPDACSSQQCPEQTNKAKMVVTYSRSIIKMLLSLPYHKRT